MALTPPTAPTPPTPPVVPRVVLGGGGSVTESTQPVSGTSDNESQARAAVARGDGPLAKTTTEAPQERQGAPQTQDAQAGAQAPTDAAAAQSAQGTQEAQGAQAGVELPADQQQALEAGRQAVPQTGGHGALYIGFSVVSFLVLGAVLFFWLRRRARQGGLRFREMARDLRAAAAPEASETQPELRGLTAGEILEDIEAEEARELAAARARAKLARARRERARAEAHLREEAAAAPRADAAPRAPAVPSAPSANVKETGQPTQAPQDGPHFEVRV